MLGVTLFGIFLSPVFFQVIRRFSRVPWGPIFADRPLTRPALFPRCQNGS
jgi:hypothetical protein